MKATHIETLTDLAGAFVEATKHDQLLAWQEGFVKVRFAESALAHGWVLQEGAQGTAKGFRAADIIRLQNQVISWTRLPRLFRLEGGSTDLTFVAPIQVMLEIKTRPDFGTKAGAQFDTIFGDVERAATEKGVAFLFVIDEKSYSSFCGSKTETRGRPAGNASGWFRSCFPSSELLTSTAIAKEASFRDTVIWLRFWRQQPSADRCRIVVLGGSKDGTDV